MARQPVKDHDIKVRVDTNMHNKLIIFCHHKGIKKAQAIRDAIASYLEI